MDRRYMDLVWDRPTMFFQAVKKYFKENKEVEDYKKRIPVAKDGEIGKLVQNIFENSYHSGQPRLTYATQYVEDFGLQLARENNGKEKVLLSRLWRIDLEPMSRWLKLFFNKTPDLYFDSPELDGENEIAQAHVWIGYDFIWDGIKTKDFTICPERKLPDTKVDDCRVSDQDLSKILGVLKENDTIITASQKFNEESPFEIFPNLKENTPLPITYKNRFRRQDHWALFARYSVVSIKGKPVKVRKTILNLLAACSNETERLLGCIDENNAIDLDLECCLSSHHLSYHQWKPQKIRGC